ncbi:glycosyltransferase family 9 protein [Thalassospiraceae bacterium LMO-JJ14]|nr:glycosyltransferase family 9 protein [Thalassospiraceae bacterium LMO-JJ14]
MRRRWWMFRSFDLIARHFPIFRQSRGLLVVRMDGIGDMMLFRQSLEHYAEAFGIDKADITVLGCDSWKAIADEVFKGYRVITIDEHAYARKLMYRFRVNLVVRRLAPKIAVCDSYLRRAMMADSLVWASAAPRTVVSMPYVNEPTRSEFTYYLSQVDEIIDTGTYPTHEIVRHFRFVSAVAGKAIAAEPPKIDWPERVPDLAAEGPYAVINPGSNEPGRRWPFESYVAIAEKLLDMGWRVAFVGTRGERWDAALLDEIATRPGILDLTGKTTLNELMDLMKYAGLVISNDTGPAHLSIAIGAPTLVVVGGGHFTSFVPYPDNVCPPNARFIYEVMDCYHCFWRCHKRKTKYEVFPCVAAVPIDGVWSVCEELIEAAETKGTRPMAAG